MKKYLTSDSVHADIRITCKGWEVQESLPQYRTLWVRANDLAIHVPSSDMKATLKGRLATCKVRLNSRTTRAIGLYCHPMNYATNSPATLRKIEMLQGCQIGWLTESRQAYSATSVRMTLVQPWHQQGQLVWRASVKYTVCMEVQMPLTNVKAAQGPHDNLMFSEIQGVNGSYCAGEAAATLWKPSKGIFVISPQQAVHAITAYTIYRRVWWV